MNDYFAALINKTAGRSAIRMKNERVYGPVGPQLDAAPPQPREQQTARLADAPEIPPPATESERSGLPQPLLRDDAASPAPLPRAVVRPTPAPVTADPPVARPKRRDPGTTPTQWSAPANDPPDHPDATDRAKSNAASVDLEAANTPTVLAVAADDASPVSPGATTEVFSRHSQSRLPGEPGRPPQFVANGSTAAAAPPDELSASAGAEIQPVRVTTATRRSSAIAPSAVVARVPGSIISAPDEQHRPEVLRDAAGPMEGAALPGPAVHPPSPAVLRPSEIRTRSHAAQEAREPRGPNRPDGAPPDHVVEVRIGRIDIRQPAQPTPPPRPPRPAAAPRLNLSDYLRRRASEGRGE